jgi:aspartyl-tRNA(Asn)/glutamyl-tRNA(Gln) amidotransferase subunit C
MSITPKEVQRIAELAHLEFSSDELQRFVAQFQRILDYFEQLQQVDTEGVTPTYHGLAEIPDEGAVRPDRTRPSLAPEAVLEGAPKAQKGYFRVPRVIA